MAVRDAERILASFPGFLVTRFKVEEPRQSLPREG